MADPASLHAKSPDQRIQIERRLLPFGQDRARATDLSAYVTAGEPPADVRGQTKDGLGDDSWNELHEEKDDQRDAEENRDQPEESTKDVGRHRRMVSTVSWFASLALE
jgi:hypothetical protein